MAEESNQPLISEQAKTQLAPWRISRSVEVIQEIFKFHEDIDTPDDTTDGLKKEIARIGREMETRGKQFVKWWKLIGNEEGSQTGEPMLLGNEAFVGRTSKGEHESRRLVAQPIAPLSDLDSGFEKYAAKMTTRISCVNHIKAEHELINRDTQSSIKDPNVGFFKSFLCKGLEEPDPEKLTAFLRALTLQIQDEDWMHDRRWQSIQRVRGCRPRNLFFSRVHVLPDDFDHESAKNTISPEHPMIKLGLYNHTKKDERIAASKHVADFDVFSSDEVKEEYALFWTQVQGLFYGMNRSRASDRFAIRLLVQLGDAQPDAFSTPIAQAIVHYHWQELFPQFVFNLLVDVVTLFLLGVMSNVLHREWLPRHWLLITILILNAYSVIKHLAALAGSLSITKCSFRGLMKSVATSYNLIFFIVDFYVVFALASELSADWDLESAATDLNLYSFKPDLSDAKLKSGTFPGRHPVLMFYVIGARWINVVLTLLNVEFIGKAILPVWEAVKSRETLIFIMYLGLASIGLTHAYYTFPMKQADDMFEAFFRVCRLFVIGDFDIYELEGVDSEVVGKVTQGALQASIEDGEHRARLDSGIRQFIGMAIFLGPVLFLNVFIGVLGQAYEDARAQINTIFMKFRIHHLKLLLFRDYTFQWTILKCDFFYHLCGKDNRSEMSLWKDKHGVWIKLPAASLQEFSAKEFMALAKEKQMTDAIEKLEQIQQSLRRDYSK